MGLFDRREDEAGDEVGPAGTIVGETIPMAAVGDPTPAARERRFERSPGGQRLDHADIADHIRAVLNAAEEAADQIRQAATEEAARMLEDARTAKLDADRARQQIEEERAKTYQAAEAVAAQIRVAAEQEAEEIVSQAHDDAARVGEDAERRRATLLDECHSAEDRLRELLNTAQQMATLIESRLPAAAPE